MRQDLPPLGFAANAADRETPLYFPASNKDPTQNLPPTPAPNPSVIDLTTQILSMLPHPTTLHHLPKTITPKYHPILQISNIKPLHHRKTEAKIQTKILSISKHHTTT